MQNISKQYPISNISGEFDRHSKGFDVENNINLKLNTEEIEKIPDYLAWTIINLICFTVLSIPGLIFCIKTRDAKQNRHQLIALEMSKKCFISNIIASILGSIILTIAVLVAIFHK